MDWIDDPSTSIDELERFPLGIVAVDSTLEVVFANARAVHLLGDAGAQALLPFAQQLGGMRRSATIDVPGRTIRILGVPATAGEPALLLFDDASRELRYERVMREFLRNAAHQLRTPLAGIAAAVETLQNGAKDRPAERDRFLAHLTAHTDRLARIARGLLLLARAEAGETLNVDVVLLAPMLAEIADEADPHEGVALAATCPPQLAAVATRDLLHETIAALVDNAVSHTEAGEIRVRAAAADETVAITVSDTGPGIPAELHERIFEPFFRTGDGQDSFGLGLAIAAQAVAAMHGAITVSSTPGEGTIFTVTLPSSVAR